MRQHTPHFSITACALAVSLFLAACGGGETTPPPDTTPPTVAISDSVPAATATGPVTFTFTFSEDVGTSFTAEDITVTGGTAGSLMKVSATVYTLVVTPPDNTTGSIMVSVAAGKFRDLALNDNVDAASATQAFDTTTTTEPPPTGTVLADFDAATPAEINVFGGAAATVEAAPAGGSGMALKIVRNGGEPWAGAWIPVPTVPTADGTVTLSARVFSPTAGVRMVAKLEYGDNEGSGDRDANQTVVQGWQTLTWTFPNLDAARTYNRFVMLPNLGNVDTDKSYHFDDLTLVTAQTTEPPATATVLADFDAATPAVINVFGGAVATAEAAPAGGTGNALKVVRNGGEPWAGAWIPVPAVPTTPSTATITARVFSPTAGIPMVAKLEFDDNQGSGDRPAVETVVQGWQTLTWTFPNLDATRTYNRFVILPNLGAVDTDKTYHFDDITLTSGGGGTGADCGTTEPTCAPTTAAPAGALRVYSDAGNAAGFVPRPDWGQTVTQSELTIADNKVLRYGFQGGGFGAPGAYQGLQWDAVNVTDKGKLHLDLWSAELTTIRISLISEGKENAVNRTITPGNWNSIDIDLSEFTVADKNAIIQIKLESATAGTLYVDNIYFWDTPGTGGGVANPLAAQGSAGPVQIPVLAAPDGLGFAGAGDAVFSGDYIGALDSNNNSAGWAGAVTRGLASNGNIGFFQSDSLSNSPQKKEENGWIVGLVDNPGGVPNFFRFYILTAPAASLADAYLGLYVNGPGNGTVDISQYGSIKFRLWGPAEMYQAGNFNPTLELTLTGAKVEGCTATGSGGTEIKKTFVANQKIGAASTYKLPLAAWTVTGVCGSDTPATAVASVLGALARVVVTVPGTSFNFTNINPDNLTYTTGVNLGPIAFTNN